MMRRREPTTPGEILREEFLMPLEMTQKNLADHIGCDVKIINRIVNGRTSVSAEMALKLGATFRISPEFWLNAQKAVDLFRAVTRVPNLPGSTSGSTRFTVASTASSGKRSRRSRLAPIGLFWILADGVSGSAPVSRPTTSAGTAGWSSFSGADLRGESSSARNAPKSWQWRWSPPGEMPARDAATDLSPGRCSRFLEPARKMVSRRGLG